MGLDPFCCPCLQPVSLLQRRRQEGRETEERRTPRPCNARVLVMAKKTEGRPDEPGCDECHSV
jgi:hypothetical protein